MTTIFAVQRAQESVATAVAEEDWATANRGIQHLAGVWLRASRTAAAGELRKIVADVKKLRVRIVARHDVEQTLGPAQIAWLLAGVSSVLSQASEAEPLTGHDTDSLILEILERNNEPAATGNIADRIGRTAATVARRLPGLRDAGLIFSRAHGSRVLNAITDAGKAKRHEWQRNQEQAFVEPPAFPTSITKGADAPPNGINRMSDLAMAVD